MDDRHAEFLIAVGDACSAASLADLPVRMRTRAGRRVGGIPEPPDEQMPGAAADDAEICGCSIRIGDTVLALVDIVECTICAPRDTT